MTAHRVPPHNLDAERGLLGAMMLYREARKAALEVLNAEDFYKPQHGHIYEAIRHLAEEDREADPVTVADLLLSDGHGADLVELVSIQADASMRSAAPTYVSVIAGHAQRRRILGWVGDIAESIYAHDDPLPAITRLGHEAARAAGDVPSSWTAIDLGALLEGDLVITRPEWLLRVDREPLLYAGKVHALNGDSESGKSWLACVAIGEAIGAHREALYVDFEDDQTTFVSRLRSLGCTDEEIRRVVYLRPDEPFDDRARLHLSGLLETHQFAVAVLDGMAEALTLNGWDENKAADVTTFYGVLPRPIARAGAAVVMIDHLVKDKEAQGRYGRGSTAKLAGVDGAVYKVENLTPFGRGLTGRSRILLSKDRPGWVRRAAAGQKVIAEMTLDSREDGERVTVTLTAGTGGGAWVPTQIMEKMSEALVRQPDPLSQSQVFMITQGSAEHKQQAIAALIAGGFVEAVRGPRNTMLFRSIRPYKDEE